MSQIDTLSLLKFIVDKINVGIFVVNKDMEVVMWSHFMESHSNKSADQVVGKSLFESFPDLPERWLRKKIQSVFLLKNYAFTSAEQRPYLFQFQHNRPVTGGVDWMQQNCTFIPIKNDLQEVELVCVSVTDVTDTMIYQGMLKDAMGRLEEMSIKDGLTGLYNRRYVEDSLANEFKRCKRYDHDSLTVMLFDLDHFKSVNDTFGHQAGDEVLKHVSEKIQDTVRTTDVPGRYGGEEFMVILTETDIQGATILAERLREVVAEQAVVYEGQEISVSVSIGLCEFDSSIENHEELMRRADIALYRAKETGRNKVVVYQPEFND